MAAETNLSKLGDWPSMLKRYGNRSAQSGVTKYAIGDRWIIVEFMNDGTYLYTHESCGEANIKGMRWRAESGKGLSTFVSQRIKDKYAAKLK